jgi:5'-3' exonuclease
MNTKSWNDLAELSTTIDSSYNNLLLVDANNVAYRWLQRINYNNFTSDYQRTIQSLSKSYEACRTIVCFDFGRSYYRMNMYDSYKQNRKKPKEEDEAKKYEEFFGVLNALPENLQEEVLKFRGVEADDILTYLVKNLAKSYDHTWIISSDRDLYQLIDDNVSIFNIFSRREITKETLKENFDLSPDEYLLSRIIEGDKSDNIIGVEGIGPKRAQGLAKEHKTFETLLKSLPVKGRAKYIQNLNASRDVLERNEKLINLKKYNEDAIISGKYGEENLDELNSSYST